MAGFSRVLSFRLWGFSRVLGFRLWGFSRVLGLGFGGLVGFFGLGFGVSQGFGVGVARHPLFSSLLTASLATGDSCDSVGWLSKRCFRLATCAAVG